MDGQASEKSGVGTDMELKIRQIPPRPMRRRSNRGSNNATIHSNNVWRKAFYSQKEQRVGKPTKQIKEMSRDQSLKSDSK